MPDIKPDFEAILDEAFDTARIAVILRGPEDLNALDCGFAWVVLRPGTHPLARYCRAMAKAADSHEGRQRYGSKHWNGGWEWWGPGGFHGQAIGHHLAGARAFQSVLAKHNISAEVGSRYD